MVAKGEGDELEAVSPHFVRMHPVEVGGAFHDDVVIGILLAEPLHIFLGTGHWKHRVHSHLLEGLDAAGSLLP